jgi:hypothetical protein
LIFSGTTVAAAAHISDNRNNNSALARLTAVLSAIAFYKSVHPISISTTVIARILFLMNLRLGTIFSTTTAAVVIASDSLKNITDGVARAIAILRQSAAASKHEFSLPLSPPLGLRISRT